MLFSCVLQIKLQTTPKISENLRNSLSKLKSCFGSFNFRSRNRSVRSFSRQFLHRKQSLLLCADKQSFKQSFVQWPNSRILSEICFTIFQHRNCDKTIKIKLITSEDRNSFYFCFLIIQKEFQEF